MSATASTSVNIAFSLALSPWSPEALEHLREAMGLETLTFGAYPEPYLIVRGPHLAVLNLLDYMRPVTSTTYMYTVHLVYDDGAVDGIVGGPRQRELEQRHGLLMHRPETLPGGVTLLAPIAGVVGLLRDVMPRSATVPVASDAESRRGQGATRLRLSDIARR